MAEEHGMKVIARIHNDFPTKFGIPHQSNRLDALKATIVFEPEYRVPEAFRGLEEYDYIWLIWQFSETVRESWSPTVRPPRLGGNTRMGVFSTRSPFRPNSAPGRKARQRLRHAACCRTAPAESVQRRQDGS